jgi:hypothetical protein
MERGGGQNLHKNLTDILKLSRSLAGLLPVRTRVCGRISKEDAIIISIRIHLGMGRLGEEQTNTCARAKRTRGRKAHRGREQGGRARARELESEREREGERGSKHHAYKY